MEENHVAPTRLMRNEDEKRPVIRWHLTETERQKISAGDDVYLFYFPSNERYSLEISPEGTQEDYTVSLLVDEPAPSAIYVRDRRLKYKRK